MQVTKLTTILTCLEDAIDFAKNWYSSQKEEIMPTMFSYNKKRGEMYCLALPQLGDRVSGGRRQSIIFAKAFNAAFAVDLYILIHESWVLMTEDKEEGEKWVGSIDKHPNRISQVTLLACNRDQKIMTNFYLGAGSELLNEQRHEGVEGEFTTLLEHSFPEEFLRLFKQKVVEKHE